MAFDGLFTRAMVEELNKNIIGGRISRIHQPFPNEIMLVIRANRKNHKVLISIHPQYARVQLTEETYENPAEPPHFCMVLRKHLEGYFIETIQQIGLDRIIVLEIKGRNEIGDLSTKQLIIEIMGRHSNILLVDKKNNTIVDSVKHISFAVNRHRAILPGQPYVMPPEQNKKNPLEMTKDDFLKQIDFNSGKLDRQIVAQCAGISPLLAKEIVHRAHIANRQTLPKAFLMMMSTINEQLYEPTIIYGEKKEAFYLFPLQHLTGQKQSFPTLSEMLDRFYFHKAERDWVKQQAQDLNRFIGNEKKKNETKLTKLQTTLTKAKQSEQYQLFGELLTANIYQMKKGMQEIEVINYYDESGATVTIPLDPMKTPSENAQSYFSRYQKAKTAQVVVTKQIEGTKAEISYFEGLLQQMEAAAPKDIEEIREELVEQGYIRDRRKRSRKIRKKTMPKIEQYYSSDGTEILVGKNNRQNEYLTMKLARRDEIWLHTKDIPGSHVVIRDTEPSETTIIEAGMLAAYFSKARQSSSVPVDYTLVRHVKKPNGAKPGYVIYDNQQTIFVTPDENKVIQLKTEATV